VAYFERTDESGYSAVRYVFGAEPTEPVICEFGRNQYSTLQFGTPRAKTPESSMELNFIRRLREARKEVNCAPHGTFARQVVQAEYEQNHILRKETARERQDQDQAEKFLKRQEKRKQKHKGH
jgi:hypothetical protein